MSNLSSSPSRVVAHGSQSRTGGTCFLDLPLELRTMVYDLCMPDNDEWEFPLPGQPKAKVMGINLLRSYKQIRQETQGRVWYNSLRVRFPLPKESDTSVIDLEIATSSLYDEALAKVTWLELDIEVDPDDLSSCGLICLERLSSFRSLWAISIDIWWGTRDRIRIFKPCDDPTKTTFLKGLVIQLLLQIPRRFKDVYWGLFIPKEDREDLDKALELIAKEYKFLQGAHYERKVDTTCEELDSPSTAEVLSVG
ncbi:unnamed protein product [Aureobasidium mustum]|uniref:Uncharacterized protein n=1 Tax=Aureobasidium mustum TaxID=2773714 RepID=A0A9N8K0Z0_9PEZI|nr:unnamed protein product [Aureobasidium mustum]